MIKGFPLQSPEEREAGMMAEEERHSGGKRHANVGDRGQRYEIRMTGYGPNAPGESVFGWSNDLDGARKMMEAILTAPGCTSATIFDRQEKQNVITRFRDRLRAHAMTSPTPTRKLARQLRQMADRSSLEDARMLWQAVEYLDVLEEMRRLYRRIPDLKPEEAWQILAILDGVPASAPQRRGR